jgi:uncharacterized membrane protein
MKAFYLLTCLFVMTPVLVSAHSEHVAPSGDPPVVEQTLDPSENTDHNHAGHRHDLSGDTNQGITDSLVRWVGQLHLVSIHFPIALIIVAALAEILYWFWPELVFANTGRVTIVLAAVTVIPTALFGWAHSAGVTYASDLYDIFWWHRFGGIGTVILTVLAAIVSELQWRREIRYTRPAYLLLLGCAVIFVSFTGFLGGELTFGVGHLSLPELHL